MFLFYPPGGSVNTICPFVNVSCKFYLVSENIGGLCAKRKTASLRCNNAAAGTFAGAHTGAPPQGTEIPLLRPEILSGFFHHLANGQVVGAARLAGTATYAGAGLFVQRGVALAPPLLQAVPI